MVVRGQVYRESVVCTHDLGMSEDTEDSGGRAKFGFMDENELSEYIDVPVATLRSMRSRGGGPPFVKLGRRVRYVPSVVDKWIMDQLRTTTGDDEDDE